MLIYKILNYKQTEPQKIQKLMNMLIKFKTLFKKKIKGANNAITCYLIQNIDAALYADFIIIKNALYQKGFR